MKGMVRLWLAAAVLLGTGVLFHRVAGAETAKEIVDTMIGAHGGMEAWRKAPTVAFTDTWYTGTSDQGQTSSFVVEQDSRRVTMDVPGTETGMVWNGEKAWSVNWASPMPPRFLALLNYYFLCLPWLTRDPGVVLGSPGTATLWDDPTEYTSIRMTFEPGVGDTPDDYYVLYIHPETHRLHACEYIVTYAALLPEGMDHTPPHILVYEKYETVDGLVVPTAFTIYEKDHSVYARCTIEGWSFSIPFDAARMTMPPEAKVDETAPTREEN